MCDPHKVHAISCNHDNINNQIQVQDLTSNTNCKFITHDPLYSSSTNLNIPKPQVLEELWITILIIQLLNQVNVHCKFQYYIQPSRVRTLEWIIKFWK
jgi:hypothetical protein